MGVNPTGSSWRIHRRCGLGSIILLDDEGRCRGRKPEINMNNRINKLSNKVTQLDRLLDGNNDESRHTSLLDDKGRCYGRHNREELEKKMMHNRINKLANNITQLDKLLGIRPINPAAAQV